jgi:HlyD family secretion protein
MRRWNKGVLAAVVACAGAGLLVIARAAGGVDAPRSAPADEPPAREVVAPGLVEGATRVIELAFARPGRITEVIVREGQGVGAGDVLARLDARVARAQLARAEATLARAVAHRDAENAGARAEEISAAQAEADAAQAKADQLAADRARGEVLFKKSSMSVADVEHLRGAAASADAQRRAAAARLLLVRRGARAEVRRAAEAEVAAARAEVDEAKALLDESELRAPVAGVVLRRHAQSGEQVGIVPPIPVVSMVDASRLRIRAEIDEQDVARVAVGREGYAQAAAFGTRRFPGRVVQIMRAVGRKAIHLDDPLARADTRVLEVMFELVDPPEVPIGLRMDVHIPEPRDRS